MSLFQIAHGRSPVKQTMKIYNDEFSVPTLSSQTYEIDPGLLYLVLLRKISRLCLRTVVTL